MWQRYPDYIQLMRFHKPIGIALLLWPTLWGLWAASDGFPDVRILVVFVLGTVLMRAAGCIINDIADRNFDKHVKRTADRPITSGKVSVKEAVFLLLLCLVLAFCLVLCLNTFAIALSFIGAGLTVLYPFTKRWIDAPQCVLGIAFAWGIPMAYAATQNHLSWECWYLFTLVVLLAIAYDTLYAMTDKQDDIKIGIKSTAILFGAWDKRMVFILQSLVCVGLFIFGLVKHYSLWFEIWISLSMAFFIYQQYLIKDRAPHQCFKAFLNHHWFVLWVWLGFLI